MTAGFPRSYAIRWYIFGYYRPRADNRSFAYPDTTHNNRAPSDPHIIFNHNRIDFRIALIFQSLTIKTCDY